jgi:hypothetical protein
MEAEKNAACHKFDPLFPAQTYDFRMAFQLAIAMPLSHFLTNECSLRSSAQAGQLRDHQSDINSCGTFSMSIGK